MIISNTDARLTFENAMRVLSSIRNQRGQPMYDLSSAQMTQSFIRGEMAMSTSLTQYNIPILVNAQQQNGNVARILGNPLQLQDMFFVNQLFVGWTIASGTTTNGKLYSWPSPTDLVAAGGTVAALQTLWNGRLSLLMDNVNVVPAWDINRHLCINQTQQNTNFNVAATTSPAVFNTDQFNGGEDGFYPVEPGWVLNGASNINAQVNLPGALSAIPTNGAIVVIFRGILLQNVTTVK